MVLVERPFLLDPSVMISGTVISVQSDSPESELNESSQLLEDSRGLDGISP
jgi:hypothetical protein